MTWTPENNRIIWGLMTLEERIKMNAAKHGWEVWVAYGWHKESDDPRWELRSVYRAIPAPVAKPDIDPAIWRFLPKWVTHIAMEEDLSWWAHRGGPKVFKSFGWHYDGRSCILNQFNLPTKGFDWRDSLIERPEGM